MPPKQLTAVFLKCTGKEEKRFNTVAPRWVGARGWKDTRLTNGWVAGDCIDRGNYSGWTGGGRAGNMAEGLMDGWM